MKIRELAEVTSMPRSNTVEKPAGVTAAPLKFGEQLASINTENYKQYFTDLTTKITKQGEILSERADIKELQRYRVLISEFMTNAVKYTYKYDKESTFDHRGRQKLYANIKKVDKRLDELADAILKEQKDNLEIMNLVEDIRGLVVDMFL